MQHCENNVFDKSMCKLSTNTYRLTDISFWITWQCNNVNWQKSVLELVTSKEGIQSETIVN